MSKEITRIAKLQIIGGQAKPGAALASVGINMPQFCVAFNEATKTRQGEIVPVIITAYKDKSFDFVLKQSPATALILKAANLKKGSKKPNSESVGEISLEQLTEIAKTKLPDLNTNDLEVAKKIIAGSAKSLGIKINGYESSNFKKESAYQKYWKKDGDK